MTSPHPPSPSSPAAPARAGRRASLGAGLRKTSPEALAAQGHARRWRDGDLPPVSRTAALGLAKRAAAALGLKAAKIALIDQLFAFSKPGDWGRPGVAPVVWPSNARLARSLGVGVSTMKYHLNGLVQAGLVAYSDGPTYQRGGRRDADGAIVEGCGIDLSPIAARFQELTELVEAAEADARARSKASYRRTVLRRQIQALILSAGERGTPGPWHQAQAELDVIRERRNSDRDGIEADVADLEALAGRLEEAYLDAEEQQKFDTALTKFRPTTTTAEHSLSVTVENRTRAYARETAFAFGESASNKRGDEGSPDPDPDRVPRPSRRPDFSGITLPMIRQACPSLAGLVPDALESWSDLREAGRTLCVAAGINPQVWQEAREVLGQDLAVAAVAVTVERSGTGAVAKPGAYLRSLVQRGRAGRLRLDLSLAAMATGQGGSPPADGHSRPETASARPAPDVEAPSASEPGASPPDRFPPGGTIRFSRFAAIVRVDAPKPAPDPDLVADAFRRWMRERALDPVGADLDRLFARFCRRWRAH